MCTRVCLVIVWSVLTSPLSAQEAATWPVVPDVTHYGLSNVRDNTWLRHEENAAYYGLLEHARHVSPQELQTAAREFMVQRKTQTQLPDGRHIPIFKDLLDHPEVYRGQPITLQGHLQQVTTYAAAENPWGITTLYEASFFEEDAQGNLTTVVFLELPPGLVVGDALVDHVTVTGYFLKTYFYDAQDQHTHKAPLLLARTLQVKPLVAPQPLLPSWLASTLAVGLGLAVIALVVWVQLRDKAHRRQQLHQQLPQELGSSIPAPTPIELPTLPPREF